MIPIIRWRLCAEIIQNILFYSLFPFMVLYLTASWGDVAASFALGFLSLTSVIASLFAGRMADQYGRRKIMMVAALGFLVSVFVFAIGRYLDSTLLIYVTFGIMGISYSLYLPASRAYIAEWVPEESRKQTYAAFYVAFNVAVILGPIIGSFSLSGKSPLFVIGALIGTVVNCWVALFQTPESMQVETRSSASNTKFWHSVTLIWRDRRLFLFVLASVFAAQAFMQLEILLPAKVTTHLGQVDLFGFHLAASNSYASLLVVNGALVLLLSTRIAKWTSRFSMKFCFVVSSLLYSLSMLMFGWAGHLNVYLLGVVIFTLGELLVVSVQDTYISNIAAADQRAQYFAAANIRYSISRIIAPQLLALIPLVGHAGAFVAAGVLAGVSAVVFALMFRVQDRTVVGNLTENHGSQSL